MLYAFTFVYTYVHMYIQVYACFRSLYFAVHIYPQPGNTTACRGSNVTIDCGYLSSKSFPIMWMINGSSYNGTAILNSPLYQQNINQPSEANAIYSLTVLSINNTTTFQCVVQSIPIATSSRGTVTVIGMYIYMYVCVGLSSVHDHCLILFGLLITYVCTLLILYLHEYGKN